MGRTIRDVWKLSLLIGLVGFGLSVCGGCATIMSGSEQTVKVTSTPLGATVTVDGSRFGVTPTNLKLSRKDNHKVALDLAGYKTSEVELKKGFNGWFIGNVIFGGIIGIVIDVVSGAVNELKPKEIDVKLAKTATVDVSPSGKSLHFNLQRTKAEPGIWASGWFGAGPPATVR